MKRPFATEHACTRLRVGDVIDLRGREHVVDFVNLSRAVCVPLEKQHVKYKTRFDKEVEFVTDYAALSISPNSEIDIKRRLGNNWRAAVRVTTLLGAPPPYKIEELMGSAACIDRPCSPSGQQREGDAQTPPIKRGRGRPRKSPATQDATPQGECNEKTPSCGRDNPVCIKRGRGRPKSK